MKTKTIETTIGKFCKDPDPLLDLVCDQNHEVVIRRGAGKDVVLVSLKEYISIMETGYLMSTEANRMHLAKSILDVKEGRVRTINPDELWK
ncbi:type II toxin-antitoxin system Phd/YefM family antitoxin [Paracnuella aquatica]|uniref:type II toxin-antitoxin system Phd/YefM family antitoxin n=1 Tax=Paracnuella aquatica TaxID=2268757 RepID=UPI000DEF0797|nr:type II toxin-antitoxin system Phd/YefM family antitoxin [Paracnuella aquatica]RPD51496.1 prevent-host-death protein [Paracnuella aquatica]